MGSLQSLELEKVEAQKNEFELMKPGKYNAVIMDASWKTPKSGGKDYLSVEWRVTAGEYHDRRLWQRFFFYSENEKAVSIAKSQFKAVILAVGKDPDKVQEPNELEGGSAELTVGVQAAQNGYEAQNQVKSVKPIEKAPAPKTQGEAIIQAGKSWKQEFQEDTPF